jgi:hypothetical protein
MGWWQSGSNEDIIGDSVVEHILRALREFARKAAESKQAIPTFEEVLYLVGAALGDQPGALVSDATVVPSEPRAIALMRDGKKIYPASGLSVVGDVAVIWGALEDVSAEYLTSELNRRPKLSELLACITFALRVEGTQFMSGVPAELEIDRIVLVGKTE